MARVQRANVILDIEDDEYLIQKYIDKGFQLIDVKTGEVLREAIPVTVAELQALVIKQQKQIEELQHALSTKSPRQRRKASGE